MTLGVYFTVFSFLKPSGEDNFVVFLFTGIVFWRWFQAAVMRSANSLIVSRGLMLQVDLNKMIPPLSVVIIDTVKFLITLLLLVGITLISGEGVNASWGWLPILFITQMMLIVGCSLFVAGLTPLFPDFSHILGTLMMLMMFCSGIFYPISMIPEKAQTLLMFNPMTVLIIGYRAVFLRGAFTLGSLFYVWVEIAMIFVLGVALLTKFNKMYPKIS